MNYLLDNLDDAWELTVIHLRLSLVPIVLGLLIAVPLGAAVQRTTALRRLTTVTASIVFTIPSLALFVVLPLIIPTRILDEANVIVALTLYTTALLVRAVPEALDAVPAAVRDAAPHHPALLEEEAAPGAPPERVCARGVTVRYGPGLCCSTNACDAPNRRM